MEQAGFVLQMCFYLYAWYRYVSRYLFLCEEPFKTLLIVLFVMPDIEIAIIGAGLGGCFASMKWTAQLLLNDDPILDHYMVLFTINHSMELRQATIGQSLTGLLRHT